VSSGHPGTRCWIQYLPRNPATVARAPCQCSNSYAKYYLFHLASSLRANAREYSKCNATHIELKLFVVSVKISEILIKRFEIICRKSGVFIARIIKPGLV